MITVNKTAAATRKQNCLKKSLTLCLKKHSKALFEIIRVDSPGQTWGFQTDYRSTSNGRNVSGTCF